MKKGIFLGLVSLMLLPLLAIGCGTAKSADQVAKTVDISTEDFSAQKNISQDIELDVNDTLTVSLGSNPSTGFAWGEAEISDAAVLAQESRTFIEPGSDGVGVPGKDVWVFDAKAPGTATVKMSYGRPWEGGEKGEWTLTINVTVK